MQMKRLLPVLMIAALVAALAPALPSPARQAVAQCGFWRWPVKTLSDPLAKFVNYHPRDRRVATLRKLKPPGDPLTWGPYKPRTKSVERRTYRIKVQLLEATRENDHDIHLVVAARHAKSKSMIVEFADPKCNGAVKSTHRAAMQRARADFLQDCGPIGTSGTKIHGTATIIGVGFFDAPHGQGGGAPNGMELHPVLMYSGKCSKGSAPSGTNGSCKKPTPGYDPCLPLGPSDYDCYGGGGNGPAYTEPGVTYRVTGSDPYDLDGNGDGYGCE